MERFKITLDYGSYDIASGREVATHGVELTTVDLLPGQSIQKVDVTDGHNDAGNFIFTVKVQGTAKIGSYAKAFAKGESTVVPWPPKGHEYRVIRSNVEPVEIEDDEDEEDDDDAPPVIPRAAVAAVAKDKWECELCARTFTSRKGLANHHKTEVHLAAQKRAVKRPRSASEPAAGPPSKKRKLSATEAKAQPATETKEKDTATETKKKDTATETKKKEKDTATGKFECVYCGVSFPSNMGLSNHRRKSSHQAKVKAVGKVAEEAELARQRQLKRRSKKAAGATISANEKEEEEEEDSYQEAEEASSEDERATGAVVASEEEPPLPERATRSAQKKTTPPPSAGILLATPLASARQSALVPSPLPDIDTLSAADVDVTGHTIKNDMLHYHVILKGVATTVPWTYVAHAFQFRPWLKKYHAEHPEARALHVAAFRNMNPK